MHRKKLALLLISIGVLSLLSCSAQPASPQPAESSGSAPAQPPITLPRSEAEVPRVSLEDGRAALESGEAVFVDVRSHAAYQARHIPGAVNIELEAIESNPAGLSLDEDRWIITYCS